AETATVTGPPAQLSSLTFRPSRLRLIGPSDRLRMLPVPVFDTDVGSARLLATLLSSEVTPPVRVAVSAPERPPRTFAGEAPPLIRLSTLVSRLPSRLPGPDCAVMSRQILLVSTFSPSRLRCISSSWRCRMGVVVPDAAGLALRLIGAENGRPCKRPL